MKKIFLLIAIALFAISTASALEPAKVAIVNTGGAAVNVQIILNDYTTGTASTKFTGPIVSLTPNSSGIIIANISGAAWTAITAAQVNSYYVVDVLVGGTLTAQYRLDQLILDQSQGGVLDTEGNLTPPESGTASIGTDGNRWEGAYVTGNTLHVGPVGGEAVNTELAINYLAGTATLKVDNASALTATATGVTVPGTLGVTGATTLGNLTGAGIRNIAVNATGQVVVAESSVSTNATIGGDGTAGSPLGLNDNAVTTAKINDDAVTSAKIVDGTIINDDINASAKIAYSKLKLINSIVAGDLTTDAVTTIKILDGAVTTGKIANGTILDEDIDAAAAIAYSKLDLTNKIVAGDLKAGSVTSGKIANGTIVNADVSGTAAIAYSKLDLASSIQTSDLTANSVKTGKINDKAVTPAKISDGTGEGQVIQFDGTNAGWGAPVWVSATAPVSPVKGVLWYDTTASKLKIRYGGAWVVI